jgi:protein-S-isoprenylcysteine O-methyltransferase Ste14
MRLFAVIRTLIIAPLFIALWTYVIPRWVAGQNAFAGARPIGWIVVAIGALIGLPSVWEFAWRGLGTPAPFDPPKKLVISGPYRFVRNPMYVGMAFVFLGQAIVFPHITTVMLTMTAILLVVVTVFVMRVEEPALRRLFGADYEDYCRHVGRWIPRLSPFDKAGSAA